MKQSEYKKIIEFMLKWNQENPTRQVSSWKTTEKSLILELSDESRKIIRLTTIGD